MTIKYIAIGAYGQVLLKEEILKHMEVKPGQKLSYKLLPGNKLLLERATLEEETTRLDNSNSRNFYDLADLIEKKRLCYFTAYNYNIENKGLTH